jgi:multidrug efflux system membrane fusion protein
VSRYYDYIGHVIPLNTVQIVPQVQGYLTKINFQEGQEVKAGDLLATIDDRPYKATLAKAEANLAQTVVSLKYSEDTVKRYAQLVPSDFVSQLNFEKYVSDVLSDEAIVKQNLADIEKARLDLNYCYMHATVDGVVGVRLIDEGNFIPAGTTNPIVILNQLRPITVEFYIPEEDLASIRKVKAKQTLQARAFLEGALDEGHDGILTLVDNQVDQKTGSILLRATFPNDDRAMWPGQFVSVRLFLEDIPNAVVIPSQAVVESQKGPYIFVVKKDGTAEQRFVKRGQAQRGDLLVIDEGVYAGETVVLEGQLNLHPGAAVVIHNEEESKTTFTPGYQP